MALSKNKNLVPVIVKVFYAYAYNVNSIIAGSDDNHMQVIFKPGFNWLEIYKVPKNVIFEEITKKSDAGKLHDQKLSLLYPGNDASNISELNDIEDRPLILRFEYDNGESRFFGDISNSVKATAPFSTDRGGSAIAFECTSRNRAFWL